MDVVFGFTDYRKYLNAALPTKGAGRGQRAKLAEALGCQSGFVSYAISGGTEFSLEHGAIISRFLGHTEEEEDYFLTLLHYARAGSQPLKRYYQKKISGIQARRREISERIQVKAKLSKEDQLIYYSSWHYQAVHMCLYIPTLRTRAAIGKYLQLPSEVISRIVQFLIEAGLAEDSGKILSATPSRTHLPANSPLVNKHHTNWRLKAIGSLDESNPTDLHYSGVFSLSESAAEKMREILLRSLSEMEPVIQAAQDETIYVLSADLFRLVG